MKHSLLITVHGAQLESQTCAENLVCCAQVASLAAVSARVRTDVAQVVPSSGSDRICASWEEHLKLVLYDTGGGSAAAGSDRPVGGGSGSNGGEYVAAGSLGVDDLLDARSSSSMRQQVSIALVDEVGRHAGDLSCTLRVAAASAMQAERHAA
ncbi:hypothetical protein ABPG77_008687 [Micractinium sp. CCAP 211/92]